MGHAVGMSEVAESANECEWEHNLEIEDNLKKISTENEYQLSWIPYDDFTKIEEISKGGFATVYYAICSVAVASSSNSMAFIFSFISWACFSKSSLILSFLLRLTWSDGIRKIEKTDDYHYVRSREPSSIVALKTLSDFSLKEFKNHMKCMLTYKLLHESNNYHKEFIKELKAYCDIGLKDPTFKLPEIIYLS
ncbi:hypothetical protein C2G38_2220837 [Gigaspora rosea]|uniref:Protein kinase domain-containing protein n=1 Tax=Gigaspora rosea TaxID=44941 RepID=A0A397U3Z7_9GLOM|nr:hypothetical protein C2G38_2220837 [Gigaspora rosea]